MHRQVVKRLTFPLHEWARGRKTMEYLRELEQNQWLPWEELRALQWRKLKSLLRHAYESVPYYEKLFRSMGMTPEDVRTMDDLREIPPLTKAIIRENLDALRSRSSSVHLIPNSTGGSSGQPLRFYSDRVKEARGNAGKFRCRGWWGIEIGDPELHIWGNPVELSRAGKVRALKDRLLGLRAVSAYGLTRPSLLAWVEMIKRHRPRFFYVYPSALVHFCHFLVDEEIDLRPWSPEYVISTAETLTRQDRALVEQTLGTRVIYEYGAHDGSPVMAHDCPCGRMHTMDDLVLLEVARNGAPVAPHELGEILVTNLDGYGMPFIRYAIGDMARQGETACEMGRGFGSLAALEGRVGELLYGVDGTPLPGLYLTGFFQTIPGIRQFQVVQIAHSGFIVRIVAGKDYARAAEGKIEDLLRERLGHSIVVTFEYVPEIGKSPSGKTRWVINKLAASTK